jgi:site-specific DNA-methyltransferase (adenine-specific)
MHGSERQDGTSTYASISMPNTFSMSPNYVRRFVETNRLNRVPRDIFQILFEKIERLFREPPPSGFEGTVIAGDAKRIVSVQELQPFVGRVKLVVTSPPYLDVVNYARQNWIRKWLLEPDPKSALAESLDDNLTLKHWLDFVEEAVLQIKQFLAKDGILVMVVGDVAKAKRSYISLAREFIQRVRHDKVFPYVGCFQDYIGQAIKTTRIWKDTRGRATDVDRIIVLSDIEPTIRVNDLIVALALTETNAEQFNHMNAITLARNADLFTGVT